MLIIDGHLDLSMNALEWNRDLTLPVSSINEREKHLSDLPGRGHAVVSLPHLRQGGIGLVVATQIARYVAAGNPLPGWNSTAQAWAQTQGQLGWYRAMELAGEMVQITNLAKLENHVALWESSTDDVSVAHKPVGYILSLEGADSLVNLDYLETAWSNGLRAVGPAHYGPGRYANGTDSSGTLGPAGRELLKSMEKLKLILDVTHLCEESFWEALEHFGQSVWASHSNCRALVDHNRQFSDDQLKALFERKAVVGVALDAWMMVPGWKKGNSEALKMDCGMLVLVNHIDHICQLAGNALSVAIGSDLDGGFGREQCPYDLETIADLQTVPELLDRRGYAYQDVMNIMHGNWLRFLRTAWAQN